MYLLVSVRKVPLLAVKRLPKVNPTVLKALLSGSSNSEPSQDSKQPGIIDRIKLFAVKNSRNVAIGGSILVAAGLTRGFYSLTYSFLSLTPYQSLYYGFMGGVLATGTTAGLLYISDRSFSINPDRAVRATMSLVYKNQELKTVLGSGITVGPVKSYTNAYGTFGLKGWVHPEIQVAFPVQGSAGEGLVTAVYRRKGLTTEVLEYVGIEFVDKNRTGNNVKLLLRGDESKFTIKNQVKQHGAIVSKKYLH